MTAAFKTALGGGASTVSSTTVVITTTAAIAIGDLVVVRACTDNLTATTPTLTCADSGGNTYTIHVQKTTAIASAQAGCAGAIFATLATAAVAQGGTITVTASGAVLQKAAYAESFSGMTNTVRSAGVSATGTATPYSVVSGTVNAGDLVIGATGIESKTSLTADSDTLNGSWSAATTMPSGAGGGDAASVEVLGQYKIATGAGAQTFNTSGPSTDWVQLIVVLQAAPDPAITQAAYQFYNEGTPTTSVGIVAQDTPASTLDVLANRNIQLRIRLQTTTAVATASTDDFQLQVERDFSGTWNNVTTVSTYAAALNSAASGFTEGAATTSRLSAGTGSFVAGKMSEDGVVNDVGWAGNSYTELLWSLVIKSADVLPSTSLEFRVLYNGATTQMTYTLIPRLNVIKSSVIPLEGLNLWLDADDASTFTLSGSTATEWRDKSGKSNHFSGGALTRDGVIGTRTSLRYPGLPAAVMTRGGPVQTVTDNWSMILVCKRNTGVAQGSDGSIAFINGGGANAAADGYGLGPKASTSANNEIGWLVGGVVWFNSSTLDTGSVHVQQVVRVGTIIQHYVNGVATNRNNGSMNNPITPSTNSWIPTSQTLHGFAGDICEILLYDRALSVAELLLVNTYLSAKWVATGGRPKVWSGSAWATKPLKVWSGSAWVEKPVKVWTGSAWKTLT